MDQKVQITSTEAVKLTADNKVQLQGGICPDGVSEIHVVLSGVSICDCVEIVDFGNSIIAIDGHFPPATGPGVNGTYILPATSGSTWEANFLNSNPAHPFYYKKFWLGDTDCPERDPDIIGGSTIVMSVSCTDGLWHVELNGHPGIAFKGDGTNPLSVPSGITCGPDPFGDAWIASGGSAAITW